MLFKGSRYEKVKPFAPAPVGRESFPGIRAREVVTLPGVLEHVVKAGDRLDLLARHYFNDDRQWWRIVDANPEILVAGQLRGREMEGRIILIPAGKS